jgi:hypothetical protein
MLRNLLLGALLFAVPFVIFAIYVAVARAQARYAGRDDAPSWTKAPWLLIFGAGTALVVAGLITLRVMSHHDISGSFVPPRYEDGRIVPGEIRPPDAAQPAAEGGQ